MAAENLRVGVEGHRCAAPVRGRADLFNRAERFAARKALLEQLFVLGNLNHHQIRQRVDDRRPHAMQPARGFIRLAVELAPGMERAQNHLQRRFVGKFRVGIHRDPATIVADGQAAICVQLHFDAAGMACHRLVHRVVQNLGRQMVIGALINAADIHARAQANGL